MFLQNNAQHALVSTSTFIQDAICRRAAWHRLLQVGACWTLDPFRSEKNILKTPLQLAVYLSLLQKSSPVDEMSGWPLHLQCYLATFMSVQETEYNTWISLRRPPKHKKQSLKVPQDYGDLWTFWRLRGKHRGDSWTPRTPASATKQTSPVWSRTKSYFFEIHNALNIP